MPIIHLLYPQPSTAEHLKGMSKLTTPAGCYKQEDRIWSKVTARSKHITINPSSISTTLHLSRRPTLPPIRLRILLRTHRPRLPARLIPLNRYRIMAAVIPFTIEPQLESQVRRRDYHSHGEGGDVVFLALPGPFVLELELLF